MLLNLRTLNYLCHADIYRKAINILLKKYVWFSAQFYKYERAVKKAELADAEESEDNDYGDTLIINSNGANTDSTHLQNASYSLADGSSNLSEKKCEETLKSDDAENAKRSFKTKTKRWCGYVVDWKSIYPNTELLDGELDPMDDLLQLNVGRVYLNIIQ